jgi:hypothetical protein
MESDRSAADRVDELIRQLASQPPDQALVDLTAAANRAVIELHKLARQEANSRRGQADWGKWARLANAARSGVLQLAAVRDSVKAMQ